MELQGRAERYVLYEPIGVGGMATVYRARGKHEVAIKRLHPHLAAEPDILSRFRDEVRISTAIHHPNIVRVLELIEPAGAEQAPSLVLELVDGGSLAALAYASWNRDERIEIGVASALVLDVLAALEAVHGRTEGGEPAPIIHRDVSPHNVLVTRDGVAKLTDFGIAKIGRQSGSTAQGHLKGKVAYMAPEQLTKKPVGERSDLYAVGVVLWELLASEKLFEGDLAEIVTQVLMPERRALAEVAPHVPSEVAAVVMRSIDPAPEKRFASAAVMAEVLRSAAPPASRATVTRWVERVAPPRRVDVTEELAPPSSLAATRYVARTKALQPRPSRRAYAWLLAVPLGAVGAWWTLRTPARDSTVIAEPVTSAEDASSGVVLEALPTVGSASAVAVAVSSEASAPAPEPSASASAVVAVVPPRASSHGRLLRSARPQASSSGSASASASEASGLKEFDSTRVSEKLNLAIMKAQLCTDFGGSGVSTYLVKYHPTGGVDVSLVHGPMSGCAMMQLMQTSAGAFAGTMVLRTVAISHRE